MAKKSGSNIIIGNNGDEHLNGGSGNDVIHGMGGNDRINAGSGNDIMDGGAGDDIVNGDAGNDLGVYVLSENVGSRDVYDGGSGIDTLQLVMTRAEWESPAVQADIARYLVFLARVIHPTNGQAKNEDFTFSFGLIASKFENLRIIVDGVEMDPTDQAVTLVDDVMAAGEDNASVAVDVLLNDSVPDLIASLTNTQPSHGSVTLTRTSGAPATADTASFVYTPDAAHWQYLAAGETATDTFTYTVTDSDGDVQTATVTVTITGSNDAPTLTAAVSSGSVVEDGSVTASGTIDFADADLSDSHTVSSSAEGAGYLGTFTATITDDGAGDGAGSVTWDFAVDNGAIQYLAEGETLTQTYTVTIDDGQGGTVDQTVTVTITGTNDTPTITAADSTGSILEDSAPQTGVVGSETLVVAEAPGQGIQFIDRADLRIAPNPDLADDGQPSLSVAGEISALGEADSYQLTLVAGEIITLDIDGAAGFGAGGAFGLDAEVLVYDSNGVLVNLNDDAAITSGGGGSNFSQDSYLQFVAPGDGVYTIVVRSYGDYSTGPYRLQVSVDSTSIATLSDSGVVAFADVDLADSHDVTVTANGADYLGQLTAVVSDASTGDGSGQVTWTYEVGNAAIQFLAAGETRTESFTLTVDDGQGGTVSQIVEVTVTGTNDAPIITSDQIYRTLFEDTDASTTGVMSFADVDLTDGHTVGVTPLFEGYVGSFVAEVSDDTTGDGTGEVTWTFNVDPADIQYLSAGQGLQQRYSISIDDGNGGTTEQLVIITIRGTNDLPTITSAVDSAALAEDGVTNANGVIEFADVDLRDGHLVSSNAAGGDYLGSFNAWMTDDSFGDGAGSVSWDFAVDNAAIQHLAEGETVTQTYTVTVDDGRGGTVDQTVTITLTGTNDAPLVQNVTADATEDGAPITVAFSADDVDSDDDAGSLTYAITSNPAEGTVVNNGDGTFAFSPGTDFQDLAEGETRDIVFSYEATDSHGATTPGSVTITVTGVNDAPVVSDVSRNAGFSAGLPLAIGGYGVPLQAVFSLTDRNGDGHVETASSIADLGIVGFGYGIASGDIDGDGDVDIAIATNTGTWVFTNQGDTNGDGIAEFTGVRASTAFAYGVALGDLNGDGRLDLVTSQGGVMTEMLNLGDSNANGLIDDFSVRSVTGGASGSNYGITMADLNGDGRMDILMANYSQGPTEIRYNLGDTNGDGQIDYRSHFIEDNFDENALGVAAGDIDGDGDLDFVVSRWSGQNEVVYLNNGDTNGDGLPDFTTIELPTGGWTLESELIDIDGDGDLDIVSTELSGAARITYNLGDTNGDGRPEFVIQNIIGANSSYGLAVGDVDGDGDLDIVFASLNGAPILMENLGDTDGDGQLNFNRTALLLNRSWDAEFVRIGGGSGAIEDGQAITGAFDGDDVDSDDDAASLTYTVTSDPSEGTVVNNGDGTFAFSPGSDFQDLGQGESRTVTFTYTATDSHGAVSEPGTVTIQVAGTNDAPTATVLDAGTFHQNQAYVGLNVLSAITDVDTNDTLTLDSIVSITTSNPNRVFDSFISGNDIVVDTGHFADLGEGDSETVTFVYSVSDGHGGTVENTVSVVIEGRNDAPFTFAIVAETSENATPYEFNLISGGYAYDTDNGGWLNAGNSAGFTIDGAVASSSNAARNVVYSLDPATGAFSLDPAQFVDLLTGQSETVTVSFNLVDDFGASVPNTLTLTINGITNQYQDATAEDEEFEDDEDDLDGGDEELAPVLAQPKGSQQDDDRGDDAGTDFGDDEPSPDLMDWYLQSSSDVEGTGSTSPLAADNDFLVLDSGDFQPPLPSQHEDFGQPLVFPGAPDQVPVDLSGFFAGGLTGDTALTLDQDGQITPGSGSSGPAPGIDDWFS